MKTGLLAGEPLWELDTAEQVRRCAAFKAAVCLRDPHERGERRAAQPRPHVRARARSGVRLPRFRTGTRSRSASSPRCALSGLDDEARTVEDVLAPSPSRSTATRAWAALQRDKKARGGRVRLVLLDAPGKPRRDVRVEPERVRAALDALIA